jgi:hypothetical protein
VSNTGDVEIWPVLLEHAIDKLRGAEGYAGGFPGSVASTWNNLTGNPDTETGTVPSPVAPQTWSDVFDTFVSEVLEPTRDDGGALVLESKPPKLGLDNQPIDGTVFGDGDRTIIAKHAYVVLDWDESARTLTLYNPHGVTITIPATALKFFNVYNQLIK